MKPLVVLITVFLLSLLLTWLVTGIVNSDLSGRIAMAVMLLFTAIGHFKFQHGMAMMMPDFIPMKKQLVYATGVFEIVAGLGLLFNGTEYFTGIALIIFFLLILPANINAAIKNVDFEKETYEGNGPGYLWFRIPLQVLFICWVYWFAVR
jgi:uncharacterized membrane protein